MAVHTSHNIRAHFNRPTSLPTPPQIFCLKARDGSSLRIFSLSLLSSSAIAHHATSPPPPTQPISYHNATSIYAGGIECCGARASNGLIGVELWHTSHCQQPASSSGVGDVLLPLLSFFSLLLPFLDRCVVLLPLLSAASPIASRPFRVPAAATRLVHVLSHITKHNTNSVIIGGGGLLDHTRVRISCETPQDAPMD